MKRFVFLPLILTNRKASGMGMNTEKNLNARDK